MFSTMRNQPRQTMMAATWLVRSDPTPDAEDGEQREHQDHAGRHRRDLVDQAAERAAPGRQGDPAADQRAPPAAAGPGRRRAVPTVSSLPTTNGPAPGRHQERGGDRLVPELDGDDEHPEQEREEVALAAESGTEQVAQLLGGVGDDVPGPPLGSAVAVVDEVDQDRPGPSMTRATPASTHGTAVVRILSHSERTTAIMTAPPARAMRGRAPTGRWTGPSGGRRRIRG